MKKLLLALLVLISYVASAQPTTLPNYTTINSRYNWLGVMARAFNVSVKCGYPSLQPGQWVGSGAMQLDSCLNRLYYYRQGIWYPILDSATIVSLITSVGSTNGLDSVLAHDPDLYNDHTSDFDSHIWTMNNVGGFVIKEAGGISRMKITDNESELAGPGGLRRFDATADSLYAIGLHLTTDTTLRVQMVSPVTGALSYMIPGQLPIPISSLLASTKTNSITNAHQQTWDWSSVTSSASGLSMTGTFSGSGTKNFMSIAGSGTISGSGSLLYMNNPLLNGGIGSVANAIHINIAGSTTSQTSGIIIDESTSVSAGNGGVYVNLTTNANSAATLIGVSSAAPILDVRAVGTSGTKIGQRIQSQAAGTLNVGLDIATLTATNNYAIRARGASAFSYTTTSPTPTAIVWIDASTSTIPQLKLAASTLISPPQAQAIENTTTHIYWTDGGGTRYQLDQQGGGSGGWGYQDYIATLTGASKVNMDGYSLTWDSVGLVRFTYANGSDNGIYDFNQGTDFLTYNATYSTSIASNPTDFINLNVTTLAGGAAINFDVTNTTTFADSLKHRLYRTIPGTADSAWTKDPITGKDAYMAVGGGSSLFPLSGTGTATGAVTGNLGFNNLSIVDGRVNIGADGGSDYLLIDPADDNISLYSVNNARQIQLTNSAIFVTGLNSVLPDTSAIKVMGYKTSTNEWVYTNWAYAGGGGGSPAGNQGNIQLKNGSSFGTPASDSLTFTSTGLKVIGGVNLGGTSSSNVRLVDNSTNLAIMLGDGSAYTSIITAGIISGASTFALANTTATTINFGGAATTLNVGGTPTGAITHNYSTNATATATTKTVNIATGGASGSTTNVNIGDADGGTIALNAPNINLTTSSTIGYVWTASGTGGQGGWAAASGGGITVGTTSITSGTASRLAYETSGNKFGEISGATSDGTSVTFGSGNLLATRPRITTSIDDANGNESLILTATSSAVNEITIANGATGVAPSITASGETNVGLDIAGKGSGDIRLLTAGFERMKILGSPITGKFKATFGGSAAYMDYGVDAANTFSFSASSVSLVLTSDFRVTSNGTGSLVAYNGTVNAGSISGANSTLQTKSFATAYRATATSVSANATDNVIVVTATGQTITLPTAASITGRIYTIKLTASGSGTVATTSSQTIDGSTTYSLSAQYKFVTVQSDGSNWNIIGNN